MERDPRYPPGGVVYQVSKKNVREALSTGLLGMPDDAWSFVQRIQIGTPIFLFDGKAVHGTFEAKSPGTFNLNSLAYHGTWQGSPLPCQVQVKLHYRYEPASLSEFNSVPGLVLKGAKIQRILSKAQVNQMYGIFNHILEWQQRQEQQSSLSSGMGLPFLPLPPTVQPEIPPAWTESPSSNSMALHTGAAAGFPSQGRASSGRGQNSGGSRKLPPRGSAWQSAQSQPGSGHSQGLAAGQITPASSGRSAQRGSRLRPQMSGSSSSGPGRRGSLATGQSHRLQGQPLPPAIPGTKRKGLDNGSKTTVILNNLPGELTIDMAIRDLDANGFYGAYDFFYFIPTGVTKTGCIILNLVDPNLAEAIFEEIDAITAHWQPFRRPPKPPVQWARQQGLAELHASYPQAPTRDRYPSKWCIRPRQPTFFDLSRAAAAATAPPGAFGSGMPVLPQAYVGFAMEEELLPPPLIMPAYDRMPTAMLAPYADSMPPWAGQNGRRVVKGAATKRQVTAPTGQGARKKARTGVPVQTVQPVAKPARTAKHTNPTQQKSLRQHVSQPQPHSEQGGPDSLTQRLHSKLGSKPIAATAVSAPPKQPVSQPQPDQRQSDSLTQRLHSALGSSKPTAASVPKQPVRQPQKQRLKPVTGQEPQRRDATAAQLTAKPNAPASAASDTSKSDAARDVRAAASLQTPGAAAEDRRPAAPESAKPTGITAGKPRQSEPDSEKHSSHLPAKGQDGAKVAGSAPQSKAGARAAVHVRAEGRAIKPKPIIWNEEQAAANAAKIHSQPGSTIQPLGIESEGTVGGAAPSGLDQPAFGLRQGSQKGAARALEHAPCVQRLPQGASEGQKGVGSPESVPIAVGAGQGIGTLGSTPIEQRSHDRLQQDGSQAPAFDYGANFVEL